MIRSRIAPTPSGFLHLGNAFSFILTWLLVKSQNGKLVLRIDDADTDRFRIEYLQDIFDNLDWLGLDYDEGAKNPTDFLENYSQQKRFSYYQTYLEKLVQIPNLIYACQCSRKEIFTLSSNGVYPKTCSNLDLNLENNDCTWRVRVPENTLISFQELGQNKMTIDLNQNVGDFVIRKKDRNAAYQLSSLLDDRLWKINLIVRGKDLLYSTASQIYLAQQIGFQEFTNNTFVHHSLVLDLNQQKLSKSNGSESLQTIRKKYSKSWIFKQFAVWYGLKIQHIQTLDELLDHFIRYN